MDYIIDRNYENVRADKFVRKKYSGTPLSAIFAAFRTKKIKINGKVIKGDYRLQLDDVISISLDDGDISSYEYIHLTDQNKRDIKKSIVYNNHDIVIINKSPGLVMHKGSDHAYGLVDIMRAYFRNPDFAFANRIDKATSGLVIGCGNLKVLREMTELIRNKEVIKRYYILVAGVITKDKFECKSYLKKIADKVIETTKDDPEGAEAISNFSVIKRGKDTTLLEGTLSTGRTHQLRVQLAGMGYPILGDRKYGDPHDRNRQLFLFSHQIKIPKLGIDVSLGIPPKFL